MKKNTTKKIKPAYTVDITKCQDAFDVLCAFGKAKQKAGLPITDLELDAIIDDNKIVMIIQDVCIMEKKKRPWYKRFWRWLTRKKD